LTLPDLEPLQFGSLWFFYHEELDEEFHSPVHTFTVGAARPSDLDEPAVAAYMYRTKKEETLKKVRAVVKRLDSALVEELGEDWVKTWYEGVPNCLTENDAYNIGQIVSLHNMIKAWGMLGYAKDRYGTFDGNVKNWNFDIPTKENIAKKGKIGWGYMPGIATESGKDYSELLVNVPNENKERVKEAIEFVYKFCSSSYNGPKLVIPEEWETAYDMRPWCAFPERK